MGTQAEAQLCVPCGADKMKKKLHILEIHACWTYTGVVHEIEAHSIAAHRNGRCLLVSYMLHLKKERKRKVLLEEFNPLPPHKAPQSVKKYQEDIQGSFVKEEEKMYELAFRQTP